MQVIFRDLNTSGVVPAVKLLFPEWDVAVGDIWEGAGRADIIVSPANCTGRMDGGIDQVYINRFGWQLEARLMRDIRSIHGGRLPIGEAHLITTYDERPDAIPLMICAPTMEWPPGDVSRTQNAYLAFKAVLLCALNEGVKALGRVPTLLMPGLATATGRMPGHECAAQLHRAWSEVLESDAGFRTMLYRPPLSDQYLAQARLHTHPSTPPVDGAHAHATTDPGHMAFGRPLTP